MAISRAQHQARIYTNSVEGLPAAIARRYDKTTALEIARERQVQRQAITHPKISVVEGKPSMQRPIPTERKLGFQVGTPSSGSEL